MSSQESAMSTLDIVQKNRRRTPNRAITTHNNTSIKGPRNQRANTTITTMRQSKLTTDKQKTPQKSTDAVQLEKNLHEQQTNQQKEKTNKTSRKKRIKEKSKRAV